MKKPIVRNWMRYWAGTLAVSGMLVVGACSSDSERRADDREDIATTETTVPARDNVSNRDTDSDDLATANSVEADAEINNTDTEADATVNAEQDAVSTSTTATDQSTQTTANRNWSSSRWSGGSVSNIDKHIEKHAEVNEAIEQSLSEIAGEGDANNMQGNQNMALSSEGTQRENEQTGVTYDNMSNQNTSETAQTDDQYAADQENAADQEMMQAEGTEGVEMERTATEGTDRNRSNMVNDDQQATYDNLNNTEEADADVDVNAEVEGDAGIDVDADADVDVTTDANTETGIDVDADADMDADVDTQIQTDDMRHTTETMPATDNMSAEVEEVDYNAMFEDIDDTEQYGALELARMDPNLSTFVRLVEESGLAATFEAEGPVTIFAPTNQAFEQLSQERLDELRDPAKLAEVLNLHILANEEVSTAMLNSRSYIDREGGDNVEISTELQGTVYYVGGAQIVKSDIETSNGILHVVDDIIQTSPDAGPGPGMD